LRVAFMIAAPSVMWGFFTGLVAKAASLRLELSLSRKSDDGLPTGCSAGGPFQE
jgi:hypothetical protein